MQIGDDRNAGHDGTIADDTVGDGKLIGCALMKLDYTNSNKFAFSAEITTKNNGHGWAIKIYLQTENTSATEGSNHTYKFTYNIVFLTRDDSSKTWSANGGIYMELSSPGTPSANISFPSQTLLTNGNKNSSITETSKSWFATWEESSGNDAKEIFDDIKVDYDSNNKLYLGQQSSESDTDCSSDEDDEGSEDDACDCDPKTSMDPKKKYKNHRWEDEDNGSMSALCSKYKSQLQGKKGKWIWHEDAQTFCNDLKTNSDADSSKKNKLNNYCYSYR